MAQDDSNRVATRYYTHVCTIIDSFIVLIHVFPLIVQLRHLLVMRQNLFTEANKCYLHMTPNSFPCVWLC